MSEIELSNHVREGDHESWLASCGNQRYQCRAQAVENDVLYDCEVHP